MYPNLTHRSFDSSEYTSLKRHIYQLISFFAQFTYLCRAWVNPTYLPRDASMVDSVLKFAFMWRRPTNKNNRPKSKL